MLLNDEQVAADIYHYYMLALDYGYCYTSSFISFLLLHYNCSVLFTGSWHMFQTALDTL